MTTALRNPSAILQETLNALARAGDRPALTALMAQTLAEGIDVKVGVPNGHEVMRAGR